MLHRTPRSSWTMSSWSELNPAVNQLNRGPTARGPTRPSTRCCRCCATRQRPRGPGQLADDVQSQVPEGVLQRRRPFPAEDARAHEEDGSRPPAEVGRPDETGVDVEPPVEEEGAARHLNGTNRGKTTTAKK